MRTTATLALLCALSLPLAACGTDTAASAGTTSVAATTTSSTSSSPSAATSTTTSTTSTTVAPTPGATVSSAQLSTDLTKAVADVRSYEVVSNLDDGTTTMDVHLIDPTRTDLSIKDPEGEMRIVDHVTYMKLGGRGRGPWMRLPQDGSSGSSSQNSQLPGGDAFGAMGVMVSPTLQATAIAKAKRTTFVGAEGGQAHYRSAVAGNVYTDLLTEQFEKVLKLSPKDAAEMRSEMAGDSKKYVGTTVYIDTWVTADGRPARYNVDGTELSKLDSDPSGPDVLTMRYAKWNAAPAVVAPAKSQVEDMSTDLGAEPDPTS